VGKIFESQVVNTLKGCNKCWYQIGKAADYSMDCHFAADNVLDLKLMASQNGKKISKW
jgi:hypothetical protein